VVGDSHLLSGVAGRDDAPMRNAGVKPLPAQNKSISELYGANFYIVRKTR
jgi:hypothetical protein